MTESEYTASQLKDLLNISVVAIHKRANTENWRYRESTNPRGGGSCKYYSLSSMSPDIQKQIVSKSDYNIPPTLIPTLAPEAALEATRKLIPYEEPIPFKKAASLPVAWGEASDAAGMCPAVLDDPRVQRIARIVNEALSVPRNFKKSKWIVAVAMKHEVTRKTIYQWIKTYNTKGLPGFRHTKSNKGQPRKWDKEAIDLWVGTCLKRSNRKLEFNTIYDVLRMEAGKRGLKIGGKRSALWWYHREVNPQLLAYQRGGLRALDNLLPPVERSYADLAPMEMLVGDQHRFDFWVMDDDTGEVFRPEGYFWQDLRTRIIYGAAVGKKYDGNMIGMALRTGLSIFGAFNAIYTDNGKPELSHYLMGIMREMRALGLGIEHTLDAAIDISEESSDEINPCVIEPGTHKKAIVKNAKAKMIEGTFNVVEAILRNHLRVPGYVKILKDPSDHQDVDHRNVMRLAESGKLLTFREFVVRMYDAMNYYNRGKAHRGVLKEWAWKPKPKTATPFQCLEQCYIKDGWRPRMLPDAAIDLVFLAKTTRVVDRGRITLNNETYVHDSLIPLHGKRIDVKHDPLDPEWVLAFNDGEFVCNASPVDPSSMKNPDLTSEKIANKRRTRKAFIDAYREKSHLAPDCIDYSHVPIDERPAALIGKDIQKRAIENKEQQEAQRVRTPEELAAEVAALEAVSEPVKKKKLPARPKTFLNKIDRYAWIVKFENAGGQLDAADLEFKHTYEGTMDADQLEHWDAVRQYGG